VREKLRGPSPFQVGGFFEGTIQKQCSSKEREYAESIPEGRRRGVEVCGKLAVVAFKCILGKKRNSDKQNVGWHAPRELKKVKNETKKG